MNESVYQAGRAWVARHGMSTYKDTTPHIPFRTGPPSSKHKDGRPSRSVPSLFSCLCRRGTPVTARARKRIRKFCQVSPCIPRSSSVGDWRTEARTGSRHLTQLKIFRLLFQKLPLTLPRFSGPPSRLYPLAGHERDLPSSERVADLAHEVRGRAAREIVIIDRIGRS